LQNGVQNSENTRDLSKKRVISVQKTSIFTDFNLKLHRSGGRRFGLRAGGARPLSFRSQRRISNTEQYFKRTGAPAGPPMPARRLTGFVSRETKQEQKWAQKSRFHPVHFIFTPRRFARKQRESAPPGDPQRRVLGKSPAKP
jgi:hypothetical protein